MTSAWGLSWANAWGGAWDIPADAPPIVGDSYVLPYLKYQAEESRRQREAQDKIIELKLEAQDVLLRKRELQAIRDKQSLRQLKALEREESQIQRELLILLASLEAQQALTRRNNMAMLALSMACPFQPIRLQ